jgi:hypothetical protein
LWERISWTARPRPDMPAPMMRMSVSRVAILDGWQEMLREEK